MRILGIFLGTLLGISCLAPAGGEPVAEGRAAAERAADELSARLLRALGDALAAAGPERAIEVCAEAAPRLAAAVAAEHGVSIRRTALRARNPANAPDAFERAWLERRTADAAAGEKPTPTAEVVELVGGGKELRYLRPILFPGAPCAQCHGSAEEIAPAVREAIAERYPEDDATGFRPGDLRGAFTVRVPLDE